MDAGQNKAGRAVVKAARRPGGSRMAIRAIMFEIVGHVVGIRRGRKTRVVTVETLC